MSTATKKRQPDAAATSLVVAEVFGPTFQGEGSSLGRVAAFVRLGGCNLSCSWCDSKFTWDAANYDLRAELTRQPVSAIVDRVAAAHPGLVVVTGGEPLLWQAQPAFASLLRDLHRCWDVEVETNGTLPPSEATVRKVSQFNVSPKLANSGLPERQRLVWPVLNQYADLARGRRAVVKFVVTSEADLDEVRGIVDRLMFPANRVFVMPEGETAETVLARSRELAEPAMARGLNMTTRLHTLLWGAERGR